MGVSSLVLNGVMSPLRMAENFPWICLGLWDPYFCEVLGPLQITGFWAYFVQSTPLPKTSPDSPKDGWKLSFFFGDAKSTTKDLKMNFRRSVFQFWVLYLDIFFFENRCLNGPPFTGKPENNRLKSVGWGGICDRSQEGI